jgi:hypothetical protein
MLQNDLLFRRLLYYWLLLGNFLSFWFGFAFFKLGLAIFWFRLTIFSFRLTILWLGLTILWLGLTILWLGLTIFWLWLALFSLRLTLFSICLSWYFLSCNLSSYGCLSLVLSRIELLNNRLNPIFLTALATWSSESRNPTLSFS